MLPRRTPIATGGQTSYDLPFAAFPHPVQLAQPSASTSGITLPTYSNESPCTRTLLGRSGEAFSKSLRVLIDRGEVCALPRIEPGPFSRSVRRMPTLLPLGRRYGWLAGYFENGSKYNTLARVVDLNHVRLSARPEFWVC